MIPAFYADGYAADIGSHVMPMKKFGLVKAAIEKASLPLVFAEPEAATDTDLRRAHTEAYVRAVDTGEPRALAESQKFPWSNALAEAVRLTNGGCMAALSAALDGGVAANIASGFHHAHADHGEGFCTFNGLVVALEHARAEGRIQRGLVVDLDLHYGNGTASLLTSRPEFFNLSIYGSWYARNQAFREVDKEHAVDTANCRSVPVANGSNGEAYLAIVEAELGPALDRARPDVILYQAGADPYREDPYSPLDLGLGDLLERDRLVFRTARARGVPIAWVLAGGYTKDIEKIVAVHVNTARAAAETFNAG